MATQRTANAGLQYPQSSDRNWDAPLVAALAALDATKAVGGLAVTPSAVHTDMTPSGLYVKVAAGTFRKPGGVYLAVSAAPSVAVTPSATTRVWLDPTGAVVTGSSYPSTDHVKLASVVAGGTDITGVTDDRCVLSCSGAAAPTVTGSRGSNAALASLLTALASRGIIVDSSS
jgi:hypothetical protein